eukprot:scaffold56452_cov59-Phaeocystis_antarctica.AAC.1
MIWLAALGPGVTAVPRSLSDRSLEAVAGPFLPGEPPSPSPLPPPPPPSPAPPSPSPPPPSPSPPPPSPSPPPPSPSPPPPSPSPPPPSPSPPPPSPSPPPPSPSPPPAAAYFTVVGPCTVDGACARSPNYPSDYGDSQLCTITPTSLAVGQLLSATAFDTQGKYEDEDYVADKLIVNGVTYSGTIGPSNVLLGSASFTWSSDQFVTGAGWEVCAHAPPPPMSPPPPKVFKVRVMAGTLIDRIDFHLIDPDADPEREDQDAGVEVKTYGATGGDQSADFDLNPGEWLVAVLRHEAGSWLVAVRFETNTGRKSQWYGHESQPLSANMPLLAAPPGQMIVGLVMRLSSGCCNRIQDIVSSESPPPPSPSPPP